MRRAVCQALGVMQLKPLLRGRRHRSTRCCSAQRSPIALAPPAFTPRPLLSGAPRVGQPGRATGFGYKRGAAWPPRSLLRSPRLRCACPAPRTPPSQARPNCGSLPPRCLQARPAPALRHSHQARVGAPPGLAASRERRGAAAALPPYRPPPPPLSRPQLVQVQQPWFSRRTSPSPSPSLPCAAWSARASPSALASVRAAPARTRCSRVKTGCGRAIPRFQPDPISHPHFRRPRPLQA